MPEEPAWAELGRLDAQGLGTGSYEIVPGAAVRLSPRVIRVTANNGSVMTGPGTNTYLLGGGPENEWAVIDPGPRDEAHLDAVLAAAPGKIRWIFATHTHTDHSPATVALKDRTGAPCTAASPTTREWQDATFAPDVPLAGGERIALPGGDDLARGPHARPRLEPPLLPAGGRAAAVHRRPRDAGVDGGDQSARTATWRPTSRPLRELLAEDLAWLAPGHGFLMAEPKRAIERIIAHRARREAKVSGCSCRLPGAPVEALLATGLRRRADPAARDGDALVASAPLEVAGRGRAQEREGTWTSLV